MLPIVRTQRTFPGLFLNDFFNDNNWSRFHDGSKNHQSNSNIAVNVEESEKEYIISVAAPGLNKKDFRVSVENDTLTIASNTESEKEKKESNFLRREFNYSTFNRSFSLPENTNADKIKASHKNGLLSISIAKEEAKIEKVKVININ